ncbi:ABC transporter permease [Paenibacillus segetis]|uniref:ABC transporter permease n=1 Tax=Paenibacillus segetis TaxID=1325360 RepID=A0ABQ1YTL7_9BACL|nr:ABC transporter permease [Paenibacillus segetis]GGH36046.1 ABC transporter permease [Paenibacillus segetis]
MIKLLELEWRKLERGKVIGEMIIYWLIIMFLPTFFLTVVFADEPMNTFSQSYSNALGLMIPIQMGFLLFGASLINHVFIEEYKNKTITLSFGYPISRKKLVMVKAMFIAIVVFFCSLVSFVLSGIATYVLDQMLDVINGEPTLADFMSYAIRTVTHSVVIALASLIPLFLFGVWKREVIPTVLCAIVLNQLPTIHNMLNLTMNLEIVYVIISLMGMLSVYLSVKMVNRLGDL